MSIKSNKQPNGENGLIHAEKEEVKCERSRPIPPDVLSQLFVPFTQVGGANKMSAIKENPNRTLSDEHIEILKKELGIIECDEEDGGNHAHKKEKERKEK